MGAGEYSGLIKPEPEDYIIAADGGYELLTSIGIMPDLVVGDFDSLGRVPEHPNVLAYPAEKDDTDMMIAVNQGIERGYNVFIIDGALGGRLDHTVANIQTLTHLTHRGAQGVILGHDMCITAVREGTVCFMPGAEGTVSVFSAGDNADGVTLKGLKYTLDNASLSFDNPIGVSNEFIGAEAIIAVKKGTLIIIWNGLTAQLRF